MSEANQAALEPGLYLVATPLGNLSDLTDRARETLSRASFIAGESSKGVLRWLEILGPWSAERRRPGVLTYRESSRTADENRILGCLENQSSVALISDAGTPCISDPGWQLVERVRAAGFAVWSIPGPCAAVAALASSGFPARHFAFEGFLPSRGKARRERLQRIACYESPVIMYESPHDLLDTLGELAALDPERESFISREMTKLYEEAWRGTLSQAVTSWAEKLVKGEFTLVLGPKPEGDRTETVDVPLETVALIRELGLPTKASATLLHHLYPTFSKREFYRLLT